jgi:hypothetical protein
VATATGSAASTTLVMAQDATVKSKVLAPANAVWRIM